MKIIFTKWKILIVALFFLFLFFQRTGKKPIESQNQPKSAKTSTVGGKEGDSMATGTIVNLALKSFKGLKPPEGQKWIWYNSHNYS